MDVFATQEPLAGVTADAVVVGMLADAPLAGPLGELNAASDGRIARLMESGELRGKPLELTTLYQLPGVASPVVVVVGLGERAKYDRGQAFRAAAAGVRLLAGRQRGTVACYFDEVAGQTEAGVAGALVGSEGQDLYRAEKKRFPPAKLLWRADDAESVDRGRILGQAMNLTRRLVNEPPSDMYPESFAARAVEVASTSGLQFEVWDENRLRTERCNSLLAVAAGAARPPRLVMLRYQGGPVAEPPLALVGKGVTFDSGGLSLKPSDSMTTMKCDMAGAATVLGAMQAISRLNLPLNVIGLVGLVENMPDGRAMKLGDVLRARSGKTIEVLNTDAEGRLVLADVLNVALDHKPARIIDLATLTGACVVALGTDVVGLMTNRDEWGDTVARAAAACGERVWPLPMFPEYDEHIKSEIADIKNTGDGRWGGAITAAKFLQNFVGETPWCHLDIAGPAFAEKAKPWLDGGATGAMLRTLVEVARGWRP